MAGEIPAALLLASLVLAAATGACAQTMNANAAAYNAGYGRTAGGENQPVNPEIADARGNIAVVNGQVQNAPAGTQFSSGGALDTFSGAGGSPSTLGSGLNVVTNGGSGDGGVTVTTSDTAAVVVTTNGKH